MTLEPACSRFEPHVAGFMQANTYVVRGRDDTLLIDAGNGVVPLGPFLADHGLEPTIVLATHAHADHIGELYEWPSSLCHGAEAEGLRTLDLRTLIVQDDRLHWPVITALPHAGFTSRDYRLNAPQVEAIEGGLVMTLEIASLKPFTCRGTRQAVSASGTHRTGFSSAAIPFMTVSLMIRFTIPVSPTTANRCSVCSV